MYYILCIICDKNLIPANLQSLYFRINDQVQPTMYLRPTAFSNALKVYSIKEMSYFVIVEE